MIKQKPIILKTANATLDLTEMGDVVAKSVSAITITLPTPSAGQWYNIRNSGAGTCTVSYGASTYTLKTNEECSFVTDGITWYMSTGTIQGDLTYIHIQNSAQTTWNINHNLGKYPAVTVVNSAGDQCEGDVKYIDLNNITLTFSAAFSGKVYLN